MISEISKHNWGFYSLSSSPKPFIATHSQAAMGGAARFLMLIVTPFPILHPRPCRSFLHLARRSLFSLSPHFSVARRRRLGFSITASDHLHTQAAAAPTREDHLGDPFVSSSNYSRTWHPWPEWSRLVEALNTGGYFGHVPSADDAFVESEGLPDEFVRAAIACLAFGRNNPNALGFVVDARTV